VEVDKQSERVLVRVRDYGKGLPQETIGKSFGMGVGIAGMRERVRQFGGELKVSREAPGTMVEARIPLFGVGITQ
jgi:two-component system NarL family sensor kinase